MSEKVHISQTNIIIADIGATTKTKMQLVAAYPAAKAGQFVLSSTEVYQCVSPGVWKIFKELPENIAYKDIDNEFGPTQSIEHGGIKTKAPTGAERSIVQMGKVKTSVDQLEIDPFNFIPWMDNGQLYKVPVLKLFTPPTYYTYALSFAATAGPSCTVAAPTDYYASEENLNIGSVLYTNTAMSVAVNTAGYYSNGSVWYQVSGVGEIVATGSCAEFLINNYDFQIDYELDPYEELSNIMLLVSSDFPPKIYDRADVNFALNSIVVDGNSPGAIYDLKFIFDTPMICNTIIALTDGTTDYAGVVTGSGTDNIIISFDLGAAKGRTFGLKLAQDNTIKFSRP